MAYVILDTCEMCGDCVDECPVEAITEGDPKYVIDPDACVDCASTDATAFLISSQRSIV